MNKELLTPVSINGRQYILEHLPKKVQALLQYHTKWEVCLVQQRLEVAKTEAALRDLQREILTEMAQVEALLKSSTPAATNTD